MKSVDTDGTVRYNVFDAAGVLVYVYDATNNVRTDYIPGPAGPIARIERAIDSTAVDKVTYLHTDHLGTARAGTDQDGQLLWTDFHTPFGDSLIAPPANDNQGDFTGHIRDSSSGLTYMQARYYDPVIGRFLSVDPVTFMDSGDPSYFNRYSYVANDPVNSWDPWELCSSDAGKLTDCPDVIQMNDGVLLQGAEFNGLETNFVSAESMERLNEVVGIVDEATKTEAGQAALVNSQKNSGVDVNLVVNSGETNGVDGAGTFSSTGNVVGTAFVATSDIKPVEVLGRKSSTGHGVVTRRGAATVAEKVIHELVHVTNPNASEGLVQGISNSIHRDRGSRQIIHGR